VVDGEGLEATLPQSHKLAIKRNLRISNGLSRGRQNHFFTHSANIAHRKAYFAALLPEKQMGEFLKVMPSAAGRPKNNAEEELISRPATLAEIGITPKQSATAQKLAEIPGATPFPTGRGLMNP
jgi:hypothetical protein